MRSSQNGWLQSDALPGEFTASAPSLHSISGSNKPSMSDSLSNKATVSDGKRWRLGVPSTALLARQPGTAISVF
jgi:hypothetical protein